MRLGAERTLFAWTEAPQHSQTLKLAHPRSEAGAIVMLAYELGGELEPTAGTMDDQSWQQVMTLHCRAAAIHDARTDHWTKIGTLPALDFAQEPGQWDAGPMRSLTGRAGYIAAVERTVEYIHAGDIFQANIAHPLQGQFEGSARAMAARLLGAPGTGHGAYVEVRGIDGALTDVVLSISPELFLDVDGASGRVVTRPIKGTRPEHEDPRELLMSEKDAAELIMIIDLMRNDLGRVCRFGSVRVTETRGIETHGDVHHAVGTVEGVLRDGCDIDALLRATFPPGSITGAPKVRAMQIIRELERRPRGPYCGSLGWLGTDGGSCWNVAIRTARLRCYHGSTGRLGRGELTYPVGAGIVADSDPGREWQETLDKASTFLRTIGTVFVEEGAS